MGECINKLKYLIKTIDFFGIFITFKVNERIEYKSLIGGTFSIIYVIFSILYISQLSIDFLKRKNVNFIYSNKITQNPFINFTEMGFTFAFGVQLSNTAYPIVGDTLKYFKYSVDIIEYHFNETVRGLENITITHLGIRKCELEDFPELNQNYYYMNDLNYMICPIYNSTSNFSIEGLYTDYYYKIISISISLSQYSIEHYDELKNYLNNNPINMGIYFKDTAIDYLNRKQPLLFYLNYLYKDVDYEFKKITQISLSRLEFNSDEYLFMQNNKIKVSTTLSEKHNDFRYIPLKENKNEYILCEFIFEASPKILQYKRVYRKIPEFTATISGVLGFVFFLMIFIANLIERKIINQKLIHKTLKFRGNKDIDINYFIDKFNRNLDKNFSFIENNNWRYNSAEIKTSEKFIDKNTEINEKKKNSLEKNSFFEGISKINSENIPYKVDTFDKKKIKNIEQSSSSNSERNLIPINLRAKTIDLEKEMLKNSKIKNIKNPKIRLQTPESKQEQEDLLKLNLCQTIFNLFCFWSTSNLRIKNKLIKSAEKKINYYMDVVTYVKTIQEFELLKEILFNENILRLFEFTSKPAMKNINGNFIFYHRIEREHIPFKKINKDEIDKLYLDYKEALQQKKSTENLALLSFIKGEINFLNK